MIQVLIRTGLFFMAAASVARWVYNVLSEEEREKQRHEQERSENIRANAKREKEQHNGESSVLYRQMVADKENLLLNAIDSRRTSIAEIPEGIAVLKRIVEEEAQKSDASPYRKSALRREYARIEDAIRRFNEYINYLDQEEQQIRNDCAVEHFEAILDRDVAAQCLPLEWLYPGKLVLVALDEINRPLPLFQHKIVFLDKHDASQKALAIRYGDEIPVLIKEKHDRWDRVFIGCIARGGLYYDHIQPRVPVQFNVEWVTKSNKMVHGTMFDGLIPAVLPLYELKHPGFTPVTGQQLLVHPLQYDLCLTHDPFVLESRKILVSESDYGGRTAQAYNRIYLVVVEEMLGEITDDSFFDIHRDWYLLGYDSYNGDIHLARSTVRLVCRPQSDFKMLEVVKLHQTDTIQIGLDSPFSFSLINRDLVNFENMAWVDGVNEFLGFCMQAALDMEDSPERIAQSRFFQRWLQVIGYQRSREEIFTVDFMADQVERDNNVLKLHVRNLAADFDLEDFSLVQSKLAEVQSDSNKLKEEYCLKLLQWDTKHNEFRPVLKMGRRNRPVYGTEIVNVVVASTFKS